MDSSSKDTYILCIETSTHVCSVALGVNGRLQVLRETADIKSHTSKITLFIQECLSEAKLKVKDLSAIAISQGPGSYTGLRIGASTAKGLCYGGDLPLIALENTDILYRGVGDSEGKAVFAAIDARRQEVYGRYYDAEGSPFNQTAPIILSEQHALSQQLSFIPFIAIGSGAIKVKEQYKDTCTIAATKTSASYMIGLSFEYFQQSNFEDIITFSPNYIKSANIILSNKKLL